MKEPSVLLHACNLSIQGAQAEGIPQVQSQPEHHSFKPLGLPSASQTHTQQVKIGHLDSHRESYLEDSKHHLWEAYESAYHCKHNSNLSRMSP